MALAFVFLGVMLWRIQVVHGERYRDDELRQSVRRVRLPGMRGRLYDRHGIVLADNRPGHHIAVYLEELRRPGGWVRTVDHLELQLDTWAQELNVERELSRTDIEMHIRRRLPMPLIAWRDIDERTLGRWAERLAGIRGVDIYTEAVRVYPHNELFAHVLGYVGRADFEQPADQPYHYYIPEMEGRFGIEQRYDEALRGAAGGRLVRVDVSGFRHEDLGVRSPAAGRDLMLTLDVRIQKTIERVLEGTPGAAVVVDPRNGEVLAMASYPAFNPNDFVPTLSSAVWAELRDDPAQPLFHRAVSGAYAPGSTFKPVTALASLVNDFSTAQTRYTCTGSITLGRSATFRCWQRHGHGPLELRESLTYSCNVYYYRLALQSGADAVAHMARTLGLGQRTGIDLNGEVAGLVPDDAWKRRTHGDAWRDGDTCNLSIGQGALTVTPLQMAMLTAAIANGGYVYRPRLVLGVREPGAEVFERTPAELVNDLEWNPIWVRDVRAGMRDAIMSDRGTGRLARIPGVSAAGKTGTAEYGPRDERRKRGWMIAYAPAEAPRYAVAIVTEDAESGGTTVAPMVRQLLEDLFAPDGELGGTP